MENETVNAETVTETTTPVVTETASETATQVTENVDSGSTTGVSVTGEGALNGETTTKKKAKKPTKKEQGLPDGREGERLQVAADGTRSYGNSIKTGQPRKAPGRHKVSTCACEKCAAKRAAAPAVETVTTTEPVAQ